MINLIKSYTHWLHTQWPSGTPEKLPEIQEDGTTAVAGTYIVGDLTGVPLLKFSADSGARAVKHILKDDTFKPEKEGVYDLVIIGGGVSGYAAALEAKKNRLNFVVLEVNEPFSTISNFPKGKPIFTYPAEMTPQGDIPFDGDVDTKEKLYDYLVNKVKKEKIEIKNVKASHIEQRGGSLEVVVSDEENIGAQRVIIAIGRSGNYRKLGAEGEDVGKVFNRLHDPEEFRGKRLLVVGGGDSALEAAISAAECDADVVLSYRKSEFSRPKAENIKKLEELSLKSKIAIEMGSRVKRIENDSVALVLANGQETSVKNDSVLSLIGREAPLDFFRKSNIRITGEGTLLGWAFFAFFFVFTIFLYDWKNHGFMQDLWSLSKYPDAMPAWLASLGSWWEQQVNDRTTFIGTLAVSMKSRSFYYTLAYTSCIGIFGWQRIKRRKTPYVTTQTISLFLVQLIPLFILPEIVLPWAGYLGAFDSGWGLSVANNLFPSYISVEALAAKDWPDWGHPRAYWHAYGFILAWPLNVYNVFTPTPMTGWLIISFVQTCIIIPALIYKYGKGAYCGWICSCGALAETMGDQQRHKMPHGPFWNKLNMVGQVILLVALIMLIIRIFGWVFPESWMSTSFTLLLEGKNSDYQLVNPISWKWVVDVLLGGILGVGLYFKYSGRVWCRFACPLAALMHIYARFSRFRIFADKKKCISCNACTSVCHQGIDVMNFANKGRPMEDPECVRCSACVQTCPTGVLSFGEIDPATGKVSRLDGLAASPVQMANVIASDRASS